MIYLDSCILIYLFEAEPVKRRIIANAIRQRSGETFCISPLSRLECLVAPTRQNNLPLLERYERFLSALGMLEVIAHIYDQALQLRAFHTFKTPDALHVATVIYYGCREFWMNDLRLSKAASISFRVLP